MKSEPQREEALFQAASQLTGSARAAFLDQACANDAALRQRLEALLTAHEASAGVLGDEPAAPFGVPPPGGPADPPAKAGTPNVLTEICPPPDEAVGQTLGRYKLREKVGEGGCGTVYVAEQTEPVRRRVALKVIKLGMDTREVIARFEAERQALAMMDHPNIAKVLDAGTTESGRPYFVMELVRGIRITDYCDQANLSTKERLGLFIKVCHAIQHAHQKGIIHRDIKPGNILVTLHDGVPVPKVIDFGIAKATEGRLVDATVYTQLHQFIGTPAYMSPEQAEMSGLDIDTRSDIYSLGVLLYQLLTSKTPFDGQELLSMGIDAMRKTIREKEPMRPSTRLSQTLVAADVRRLKSPSSDKPATEEEVRASSRRLLQIKETIHLLKGDLDWIVMKCLEKDRARRYETANGLATDLKRHLSNEPVTARPPSTAYRLQKAFRRNRLVYSAGIVVAAATLLAGAVTVWQAVHAIRAQRETEQARLSEREQRLAAQASQREAEASQRQAYDARMTAQKNLYAAEMVLASQAMGKGNLGQVRRLLAKYAPTGEKGLATNESLAGLRGWEWRHLWDRSRGDDWIILRGHTKAAWTASVLADNRTIVSGGEDGTLRFWDVETRAPIGTIPVRDDVFRLAQSLDSRWLVACGNLGRWSLWSLPDRREVMSRTNSTRVAGVAFSPDKQHFAIADWRGVEVWNAREQRRIKTIPRASFGFLFGLAYSPDGQTLAYSVDGTDLVLHDLAGGTETKLGATSKMTVQNLSFSPDGRFLVAASLSGITVWDALRRSPVQKLTNHLEQVVSLAFSPDGKTLASASSDHTVRLWDTQTWQEAAVLRGHEGEVMEVNFSPDGEFLISSGKDATVRVWKSRRPKRQPDHYQFPNGTANFLPHLPNTERFLYHLGSNRWQSATVFDKVTFLNGATKPVPTSLQDAPALAADATVSWLVADVGPGQLEVWRTDPLEKRNTLAVGPGALHSLAVGRTGAWLAFKRPDHTAEIWNVAGKKLETTLAPLTFDGETVLKPLTFWAGDRRLAHFGKSREPHGHRVDILLLPEGETRSILSTHKSELSGLAISANGELLATSAWDGEAKLWSINTGQELGTLAGQMIGFNCFGFSSDGARLVAGGWDGTITLWDVRTRQQVGHWKAHQSYCNQIVFLEHDQRLVSIGTSSQRDSSFEARVWRAPALVEIDAADTRKELTAP